MGHSLYKVGSGTVQGSFEYFCSWQGCDEAYVKLVKPRRLLKTKWKKKKKKSKQDKNWKEVRNST